jgi:hypothetical protein
MLTEKSFSGPQTTNPSEILIARQACQKNKAILIVLAHEISYAAGIY